MPAKRIELSKTPQDFENEVYSYLYKELNKLSGEYTVFPPFSIGIEAKRGGETFEIRREYDGLVISPFCVFTIEAKAFQGKVRRGYNTKTEIITKDGIVNLSSRKEDPVDQADRQWKALSNFFQNKCGFGKLYIKSIIVFQAGSSFDDVYDGFRDINNSTPFICSLDELPNEIQKSQSSKQALLDRESQDVIVKAIKEGPHKLSSNDKELLRIVYTETPIHFPTPKAEFRESSLRSKQLSIPKVKPFLETSKPIYQPSYKLEKEKSRKTKSFPLFQLVIGGGCIVVIVMLFIVGLSIEANTVTQEEWVEWADTTFPYEMVDAPKLSPQSLDFSIRLNNKDGKPHTIHLIGLAKISWVDGYEVTVPDYHSLCAGKHFEEYLDRGDWYSCYTVKLVDINPQEELILKFSVPPTIIESRPFRISSITPSLQLISIDGDGFDRAPRPKTTRDAEKLEKTAAAENSSSGQKAINENLIHVAAEEINISGERRRQQMGFFLVVKNKDETRTYELDILLIFRVVCSEPGETLTQSYYFVNDKVPWYQKLDKRVDHLSYIDAIYEIPIKVDPSTLNRKPVILKIPCRVAERVALDSYRILDIK